MLNSNDYYTAVNNVVTSLGAIIGLVGDIWQQNGHSLVIETPDPATLGYELRKLIDEAAKLPGVVQKDEKAIR